MYKVMNNVPDADRRGIAVFYRLKKEHDRKTIENLWKVINTKV